MLQVNDGISREMYDEGHALSFSSLIIYFEHRETLNQAPGLSNSSFYHSAPPTIFDSSKVHFFLISQVFKV